MLNEQLVLSVFVVVLLWLTPIVLLCLFLEHPDVPTESIGPDGLPLGRSDTTLSTGEST